MAAFYGGRNSREFRNELISFLFSFLTRVLVHPTTFEFSLKVTLFIYLILVLQMGGLG